MKHMKFLRTFLNYLQKMVLQGGFWAALVLCCGLCFTSTGYMEENISYSILELLVRFPRERLLSGPDFSGLSQFLNGMGTYSLMFTPLVAAFPSIPLFCRERSSGSVRLLLPRCGLGRWLGGFQLAAMVSGGLVLLGGYALFGLMCLALFPSPAACGAGEMVPMLLDSARLTLAGSFLLGACSVLVAVLLCGICKNACTILCGSFALLYAVSTTCSQLILDLPQGVWSRVLTAVDPTAPFYLLRYLPPTNRDVALFQVGWACVCFLLLRWLMGRRLDLGQ